MRNTLFNAVAGISLLTIASCGSEASLVSISPVSEPFDETRQMEMQTCIGNKSVTLSFEASVYVSGKLDIEEKADSFKPSLRSQIENQIDIIEGSTQQRLLHARTSFENNEQTLSGFITREWPDAESDFSTYTKKIAPERIEKATMTLTDPVISRVEDPGCIHVNPPGLAD